MDKIRNFSIIAHIDHGKSTLADRMLELTGTIEKRKMREQVLDSMELERERGITIKMQPVRMIYKTNLQFSISNFQLTSNDSSENSKQEYILNLIDTPGHIDFSYEVSRSLKAVEGAVLLIDSTQGVQAQTITTLNMAREAGLMIVPAVSKIDSTLSRQTEVKKEIADLLGCPISDIVETSGKTGDGIIELLNNIVKKVPAPTSEDSGQSFRALVFDFKYSNHKGVVVFVRVFNGKVKKGDKLQFKIANVRFNVLEVGTFSPEEVETNELSSGEIGYIVTGIKEPGVASVGETLSDLSDAKEPFSGYESPKPVVWASIYPESQDDFDILKQSLGKLKLSDSSFSYEEESSGTLGRGFRCGFLGMLHLEIITERLKREFNISLIVTTPSIVYNVFLKNGHKNKIFSPTNFPDEHLVSKVTEPWVKVSIITPQEYSGPIMQIFYEHEAQMGNVEHFGNNRLRIFLEMPLRELMRNFFDKIKSVSSGYASITYDLAGERDADVVRMDILVADERVEAFSRVIARRNVEVEAEKVVEKLFNALPKQLFVTKIQAKALGRIISSRTLTAFKKDVTGYLYGGDITRKKKLWEKQKRGKAKLKERGRVNIPQDVFIKVMKSD